MSRIQDIPAPRPLILVAAAELTIDTSGSGSGDGAVLAVSFDHVAGRQYLISWSMTARRSAAGILASTITSSLVTLPLRRASWEHISTPGVPRGVGTYVLCTADVSGTSTITLNASAKAGGATWYCFAATEYATLGAHARIAIKEVG